MVHVNKIFPFDVPFQGNGNLCNGKRFNTRADICCDGVIRSKVSGTYCCGNKNFNPRSNVCCGGVINDVVIGRFCCGTKNFGRNYQCCDPSIPKIRVRGRC